MIIRPGQPNCGLAWQKKTQITKTSCGWAEPSSVQLKLKLGYVTINLLRKNQLRWKWLNPIKFLNIDKEFVIHLIDCLKLIPIV